MSQSAGAPPKENSQTWWGRTVIGSVVALGIGWYVLEHPQWGAWTGWAKPAMYAIGGLLLLTVMVVVRNSTRAAQRTRLSDAVRVKFGPEWKPTPDTFRAGRHRSGVPQRVFFDYPNTLPDYDLQWRTEIQSIVAQRMGTEHKHLRVVKSSFPWLGYTAVKYKLGSTWDLKNGTVKFANKPLSRTVDQSEEEQAQAVDRIEKILKPSFGVGIKVSVTEWEKVELP